MVDTSARTAKLDELKAKRDEELSRIRSNQDLTPDARVRQIRESSQRWQGELNQEARRIMQELADEEQQTYRRANPVESPGDHTTELFRLRLRDEITDELDADADVFSLYQKALRLEDKERVRVLERMAPARIKDPFEKVRFARLVEENQPRAVREAKEKQARLRAERRQLELGLSLQGIDLRRG